MVRTDERRVRRPPRLRLRIPRDALAFLLSRRVVLRVLDLRRRRVAFLPFRFIAQYLRRPAGILPLRFPLRLRLDFAIFFLPFLVVFLRFLNISSKLPL